MPGALARAVLAAVVAAAVAAQSDASRPSQPAAAQGLLIEQDAVAGTLTVRRAGSRQALVTQNAAPNHRPYLHPLRASDGRVVTEDRPAHHPHQTGLFWGL